MAEKPTIPDPTATFDGADRRGEVDYPNLDQAFEPPTPAPVQPRDFGFPEELADNLPDDQSASPLRRLFRWLRGE